MVSLSSPYLIIIYSNSHDEIVKFGNSFGMNISPWKLISKILGWTMFIGNWTVKLFYFVFILIIFLFLEMYKIKVMVLLSYHRCDIIFWFFSSQFCTVSLNVYSKNVKFKYIQNQVKNKKRKKEMCKISLQSLYQGQIPLFSL